MASSRLPGKVLADVCGEPAIARQIGRMRRAKRVDAIIVATTVNPADHALAAWAESEGVPYFRGSEEDVLARVVAAQSSAGADICVPVCGDCPLLDPAVIDRAVEAYLAGSCDFVTNSIPPGYPQGQDIQVVRLDVLKAISETVDDPAVHEHTCLYLHEHPELYRTHRLSPEDACRLPEQRLQLDYPEDLALIRAVFEALLPVHGEGFGITDILAFLRDNPNIAALNRDCVEREARSVADPI